MASPSSTRYQNYGDEELQAVTASDVASAAAVASTSASVSADIYEDEMSSQTSSHRGRRWGFSRKKKNLRTSSSDEGLLGKSTATDDETGMMTGMETNTEFEGETAATQEEIYIVRQRHGYASYAFSIVQTIILIVMMVQCGVAPLNINPMVGPYPHVLSEWGGKNTILILDGEWWRLITPIFLHAGVIHLICNVMVQIETGVFFEREWGTFTWTVIYLVSAVGSSALSVIFMPDAVSVGSSGAVMGLFGGKAAEVICRCCEKADHAHEKVGQQVRKEQCAGVMCSVTVVMLFSFIPYVDWAAHLGGLIGGFCIGLIMFSADLKNAVFSKLTWLFIGIGVTAAYFIVLFHQVYSSDIEAAEELRDVCGYYKQFFEDYECNCQRQGNE